jgi:hypothetical protein
VQRYQEILNYNKHMKTAMIAAIIVVGNVILVDDPRSAVKREVRNGYADTRGKRTAASSARGCRWGTIARGRR